MITKLENKRPNILVVGDLMIDEYLWGKCNRISPEAPVQVVDIQNQSTLLGGAGNVINNLVTYGANVDVASVIGDDEIADELIGMLNDLNIDSTHIIKDDNRKTSKKSRIVATNQQILRFDKESKSYIDDSSANSLYDSIKKDISKYDVILLSDYAKGVLTNRLINNIITLAKDNNIKVLVDPKGSDFSKYSGAYLLTPNKKEASLATGIEIDSEESLVKAIKKLKDDVSLDYSVITLSEDGMAIFDDKLTKIPTQAKEVFDVTGAGDTVLASLGFGLASGLDIYESTRFANYAAAVVVSKIGSATATLNEIDEYISSIHKSSSDSHIKSFNQIEKISQKYKDSDKKVVFTNGCFDILHIGHVKYLEIAKSFGDVLILGLNSDSSVKRLKGESRPINSEYDRAYILAALECVDYVVVFEEDTPYELIKAVKPNILVKGGDYEGKEVVGSDIADELRLVEFVDGKSTTNIIKKINSNNNKQ
jgi:D-beta-D-heptose 7-phosphate kinase/D-beta-D-heptose 1-phosphate adenosyltransferase